MKKIGRSQLFWFKNSDRKKLLRLSRKLILMKKRVLRKLTKLLRKRVTLRKLKTTLLKKNKTHFTKKNYCLDQGLMLCFLSKYFVVHPPRLY